MPTKPRRPTPDRDATRSAKAPADRHEPAAAPEGADAAPSPAPRPDPGPQAAFAGDPEEWDAFPVFPPSRRAPDEDERPSPDGEAGGDAPQPAEAQPSAKALRIARAPGDDAKRASPVLGARSRGVVRAQRLVPAAVARAIGGRANDRRRGVGERAGPRRGLRRLAILAVPTTIVGAASLFVMAGLRSEVLRGLDWEPAAIQAPAPGLAAAAGPGVQASPPGRQAAEQARLAELETRHASLTRTADDLAGAVREERRVLAELADAERQRRQAVVELEGRQAELARMIDELAGVERQERRVLAELADAEQQGRRTLGDLGRTLGNLESRRVSLSRTVESLVAAEQDERETIAELVRQREAEAAQVADLERRREALAATTARQDARQQSPVRLVSDLETYVARAATDSFGEDRASTDDEASEIDVPAADSDAESGAGGSEPRVFLHYSELEPGAEQLADRVARDLGDRGVGVADIRAVGFDIGVNRVRYFFADEAATAPAIGALVAGSLGPGGESSPEVQDFTHFEPKPSLGTIEVWLTGSDN